MITAEVVLIPEHELLEQLLAERWPIGRSVAFLNELGVDGWLVLERHWADGNIWLTRGTEHLEEWRARQLFRIRDESVDVEVETSEHGARLV